MFQTFPSLCMNFQMSPSLQVIHSFLRTQNFQTVTQCFHSCNCLSEPSPLSSLLHWSKSENPFFFLSSHFRALFHFGFRKLFLVTQLCFKSYNLCTRRCAYFSTLNIAIQRLCNSTTDQLNSYTPLFQACGPILGIYTHIQIQYVSVRAMNKLNALTNQSAVTKICLVFNGARLQAKSATHSARRQ